jgi:hypothetical protein
MSLIVQSNPSIVLMVARSDSRENSRRIIVGYAAMSWSNASITIEDAKF